MKGFWNSFIACMDDLQQKGVIRGEWRNGIKVVDTLDEIKDLLG